MLFNGISLSSTMKFAIFFCVVAFACVAQAQENVSSWETSLGSLIETAKNNLEAAKDRIYGIIEKATALLKEKITAAKERANELIQQLREKASAIRDKVYSSIKEILDKFDSDLNKLEVYARSEGVDISECTVMTQTIREAGLAIISNTSYCLVEKMEKGQALLGDISLKYEEALSELKEIQENTRKCVENIDGFQAAATALACINVAGAKAYWALAKKVPGVAFDVTKITFLIATLPPSMMYCMSKNSIMTFYEESNEVFDSVKNCIDEKFEEAQKPFPDVTEDSLVFEDVKTTETPEATVPTETVEVTEATVPTEAVEATESITESF